MKSENLGMQKRFFISYASEDQEKVKEFEQALRHYGLDVWMDQHNIVLSNSIVSAINEGISGSKFALIFFSANYMRKVWTNEEMAALIFLAMASGGTRKIFVIRLDDTDLPPLLAHRSWLEGSSPDIVAKNLSLLVSEQNENNDNTVAVPVNKEPEKRQGEVIHISKLNDTSQIVLAKYIITNSLSVNHSSALTQWIEVSVKSNVTLCVEVMVAMLDYDFVVDLKQCLELIRIHSAFIREYEKELAEDLLGKFKPGFRLVLENRLLERDKAQESLKDYLEAVCKQVLLKK